MRGALVALAVSAAVVTLACGGAKDARNAKFPPLPPGCDVMLFPEAPGIATENVGSVVARCGDVVSDEECFRTLKDEACKIGANVIWGVDQTPKMELGKKVLSGRAARKK